MLICRIICCRSAHCKSNFGKAKFPHFPVCHSVGWFCHYSLGFIARPINRMLPERLSRIKNKNGWSARKTGISFGLIAITPTTAVAWLSRHAGIHAIFTY